jgi:uncharacterized membrane protein
MVSHREVPAGWGRVLDVLFLIATLVAAPAVLWGGSNGARIGQGTAVLFLVALGWVGVGLLWTVVRVRRVRRARQGDPGWPGRLAGGRTIRLIIIGTAVVVFGAAVNIVFYRGDDTNSTLNRVTDIVMVLIAWTMLQLAYTERYARMQVEQPGEPAPLAFPATEQPSLLEYAYFAFAIGTTFSTSDVTVQITRMRGVVLGHSLLAFVYNTAVLGMVLSLITG